MGMEIKSFCTTHRFHYSGHKCPFCEQERINKMCKKFNHTQSSKPNDSEITESHLEKLKEKFNHKI